MAEIVPVDADQLHRVVAVHDVVRLDDPLTVEALLDWRRQAEDMTWLVAVEGDADVGGGIGVVGWHAPPGTAFVEAWTAPGARGHGVGEQLYTELMRWSAERGCVAVETTVAEDDEASLAWADQRGFREIGRNSRLVLDLAAVEPLPIDAPPGIEVAAWADRPGIDEQLYAVYVEAEPDIPGEEHNELPTFESWLDNDMGGLSDSRDAVFVAFAGSEVVAYAKLSILPGAVSPNALHDLIAVKRAWRGRGIAGALKRRQIAWAKEHGYARLVTWNENRNEPIRRLNERYGYRVEPGRVTLRTAIAGID